MFGSLFSKKSDTDHSSSIAHDAFFEELRRKEYSRLADQGHVYLDYTGGNLYADSQLTAHHTLLRESILGNPHSTNPTSQKATTLVAEARQKVIDFFNAEDYYCIFTQNASGALKIIGECYPFSTESHLVLLSDNHNSVNGIREYCKNRGGQYTYSPIQYEDLQADYSQLEKHLDAHGDKKNKLFAFPAQSNVSGVKHDLSWIEKAHEKGWDVLLDAAAFAPTSTLDLKAIKPDFVALSFYKIFGYPTGLGCLLARKDKYNLLKKPWFAGGTVKLAAVLAPHHYLTDDHERFENGTINYLDIPALKIGLDYIDQIGMQRINERVTALTCYLHEGLKHIKHDSGKDVVKMFGPTNRSKTGGTLIMTFGDANGKLIPFEQVEEKANQKMISIRSGCFCNPGIDEINNCLSTDELARYFSSRDKGDYKDMISFLNKMRGATRVSVGLATTKQDLDTFLSFVKEFRNTEL